MYAFKAYNYPKPELLYELIDQFIMPTQYKLFEDGLDNDKEIIDLKSALMGESKDAIKREIFHKLSTSTGLRPEWGILTGIRPVKLCGELIDAHGLDEARRVLKNEYLIDDSKIDVIVKMYDYQIASFGKAKENSVGMYIGIPFCPTRCLYCSFISSQAENEKLEAYVDTLIEEIKAIGLRLDNSEFHIESLYIGGGTPTTLNENQLNRLLDAINKYLDIHSIKEYTIEAGRPDTINLEKLKIIKAHGCERISINPQSMKPETLVTIGRSHTPLEIEKAFELAHSLDFNSINADLIAGLPGEELSDFDASLEKIIGLGADNITIHSLAVKRASRLKDEDPVFHYKQSNITNSMTAKGFETLCNRGFEPYYLYRQKHMAGAGENIGYCKPEKAGLYNIRIMDEHQSILALGAGAISKRFYPEENRLERIPNVSNVGHYINRLDEMIERKDKMFFNQKGDDIC
ncbi:MAG: coproporphyrinogen dehydrogenase HemZ [[Eubacterium] sulci]|nr:coproporphyrinogen dehydrogenase HemZ [[Eubacterium] sulci]